MTFAAERVCQPAAAFSGFWLSVSYALFAKAGFTPALVARATAEDVRLVEPEALVAGDQ